MTMIQDKMRLDQKISLLQEYNTSEELFDRLESLINTLRQDESTEDFSVGDTYNDGTEWDIDIIMDLIGDLRLYTRFINEEDKKSIKQFGLSYLKKYFVE